ncbi:hypothetical protein KSC_070590 [Ktedonobacter sp. SOSP1-52]|uniref:hypothetical protein n=1 Tax=Ktedonobacter sp. SOSP1-52 TaxID=2778366 RepID=UPI00191668E1|nr:hypothetical protein [Ktedonobacter sp. SOSP1-52]GHO68167.1 hypothetical protein KSC_070590 [Ktedonobacter sp. SOSP1-52]
MEDRDVARRLTSLQARMNRIENLMQQLLLTLTSSHAHMEQTQLLRNILQELRSDPTPHTPEVDLPTNSPSQERPELVAIRQALLAGQRLKAIQLYRSLYGVSLQEAQNAIDTM